MSDIPTELLRTFITVADQRSFTQAARMLGVTQPAVSAQIKRLEVTLGNDLFDRSSPGVILTATGESIVGHARHMLSINDVIRNLAKPGSSTRTIRVGIPMDFLGGSLPRVFADYRKRWPDLRFSIQDGALEQHLGALQCGQLDVAVGLSSGEPAVDARDQWNEQMTWLRGRATRLEPSAPVPLVSFGENCVYHRTAVKALNRAGRDCEPVFQGPSIVSLARAVAAGLGVMALPRSRVRSPDLVIWEDAPLPKLPDLIWGVYLRENAEREPCEQLADIIAAELRSLSAAAAATRPALVRSLNAPVAFARRAVS